MSLLVVTDTLSTLATVHNWFSFANTTPLDVGWIASYALWGAAALHPSMARLAERSDSREARYPWAALVMLGIAAMTAPLIILVREVQGKTVDVGVLTVISAVVFACIVLRLWLVTKNIESTNRLLAEAVTRQTVFANAAEAFVGASDFETVAHAGVVAAVALAQDEHSWSCFFSEGPRGLTVVAVAGASPWRVGERYEGTLRTPNAMKSEKAR